ncbi:hypothetical protein JCM19241_5977 [Vibrio ishigakensis]|uniref:Uncharacterized protein n=1 Tax=Vibrio ishigakensis TaxID=1481914 RepID=A0A0B8QEP8_9VIBR|nr:hypothetical protein JCM19241_5977 [Vibrio ishigakensis]
MDLFELEIALNEAKQKLIEQRNVINKLVEQNRELKASIIWSTHQPTHCDTGSN